MTISNGEIDKGFYLERVRPYEVGVGYRVDREDNLPRVSKWCLENKITLRKYIPDFNSKKSNSPFKSIIIVKDGIEIDASIK